MKIERINTLAEVEKVDSMIKELDSIQEKNELTTDELIIDYESSLSRIYNCPSKPTERDLSRVTSYACELKRRGVL